MMEKINAVITGVGGYVPDYVLTNEEISRMVDTNDEWIMTRIGVKERRILNEEGLGTSYMAVVTLQMGVSNAMQRLGSSIAALTTSLVRAGHVFDFMESEMEEEITWFTAENGLERKNINVQNGRDKAIDISNLHFSYNENDESRDKNKMRAQLNSKKMQISVGEKVMITGESGCGKSTLLKLIQGFYPVENGKIKILGKDINEYSLAELRNVITYVPQDSYLFEGTIAENIAFGWNEETAPVMDVIVSAAKKAHADEFIKDLPEGYNTKVAAGGTNLSGGQRQRISIARAFMKEAPKIGRAHV